MGELLCAPIEGNVEVIVVPPIPAEHFELKHSLLNLVTSKQFFEFEKEDPHAHIRWFNKITSTMKYKDVPETAIKLMLFPFSIDGPAQIWIEKEPPRSIETWDDLVSKFINKFFPPSKTTNLWNEISNFQQCFVKPFHETWDRFKDLLRASPHHSFTELHQLDTFFNSLNPSDEDSLISAAGDNLLEKMSTNTSTFGLSSDVAALTDAVKALLLKNTTPPPAFVKAVEESCVTYGGPHPYYYCPTTNSNASGYQDNIQAYVFAAAVNYNQGNAGYRPPRNSTYRAPTPPIAPSKELANYMKVNETHMRAMQYQIDIMKTELRNEFQATMLQQNNKLENMLSNYFQNKPSGSGSGPLPSNTVNNPKSDLKAITTQSGVSYDGPSIPPPFSPSPKGVEKEPEVTKDPAQPTTNTPVNENCSTVILKKLPEKLGDPSKFLIPCIFSEIPKSLALADLGVSINLMPLSIWRNLSLPELNPTQMILELADRSTTRPTGIAKNVVVRVGKFHFPADFVVVDYDVDPQVPLILGRPFLRTARALIDVYTFEEYSQEVLGFFGNSESGNPTRASEPIIARCLPSLTPFEGEENTDVSLPEYECFCSEGNIRLFEKFLNEHPSSPILPKEIKTEELKSVKSSIDEPLELELKDLPSQLKYAFLEGTDKLPIIIAKDLKDDEKERLIKVLKSHKHAIAWKLFDIKGIDP
nr:DNA-directed DNA polymerase [Tanacetum cinerariifolium]